MPDSPRSVGVAHGFAAVGLAVYAATGDPNGIDRAGARFFNGDAGTTPVLLPEWGWRILSAPGSRYVAAGVIAVLAISGARRRDWRPFVLVTATYVGTMAITHITKDVVGRVAPSMYGDATVGSTYPSGHMASAVAIVVGAAYLMPLHRRWRSVAIIICLGVGIARLALGHHWFTDIVGGAAIAAMWIGYLVPVRRLLQNDLPLRTRSAGRMAARSDTS